MVGAAAVWVLRAYRRAGGDRPAPALIACAVAAIAALGTYLAVGKPDLPGARFTDRLAALKHRDPTTFNADEALAVLSQASRDDPRDARPHFFAGQVLLTEGRTEEAARAFDAAVRRDPRSAEALLGLGRALVQLEDGRVSEDARDVFARAAALETSDPTPWIYQAMAAMQEDRAADARVFWGEAYARMAPDDPRRAMAERMSGETAQ